MGWLGLRSLWLLGRLSGSRDDLRRGRRWGGHRGLRLHAGALRRRLAGRWFLMTTSGISRLHGGGLMSALRRCSRRLRRLPLRGDDLGTLPCGVGGKPGFICGAPPGAGALLSWGRRLGFWSGLWGSRREGPAPGTVPGRTVGTSALPGMPGGPSGIGFLGVPGLRASSFTGRGSGCWIAVAPGSPFLAPPLRSCGSSFRPKAGAGAVLVTGR